MRNPFKSHSSQDADPGCDKSRPGSTLPSAMPAPLAPAQQPLLVDDDSLDADDALPAAGRGTRALHAVVRASTVVTPQPMPLVPSGAQAVHVSGGVVLTETERVRLCIMQVQIRLSSLMLYEGPIDGMLNLDTVAGLRYFQTLKGLRGSGQATAATLRALGVPGVR